MVLINDKKFACGTCIKGHRVSGCTHTDRPLFEVKKKGRPSTQCQCCKDRRKGGAAGQVHNKCICGAEDAKHAPSSLSAAQPSIDAKSTSTTTINPAPTTTSTSTSTYTSSSEESPTPTPIRHLSITDEEGHIDENEETRKGRPGSKATYPNGLRDVHDMSLAADVLTGFNENVVQAAERQIQNLLNPCHCKSGGKCRCCQPKRERDVVKRAPSNSGSAGSTSPGGFLANGESHHFGLIDSTSHSVNPIIASAASARRLNIGGGGGQAILDMSPDNMHHPAHTSRHVHKTKLYSPYSTNGHVGSKHHKKESISPPTTSHPSNASSHLQQIPQPRPAPPRIRPLADMTNFLGAMFSEDGTISTEISRAALGLPGIHSFDSKAAEGGVKVESMDLDADEPISFPTSEDLVIGACTCGVECECPGCLTHGNGTSTGTDGHAHGHTCGDSCKSSFDCGENLVIPSGITSIDHLLSVAASSVPHPARPKTGDLLAHDTRILPPAVHVSEEAARHMGIVQLKPLECCNGRCQCAPGECTCKNDCCGCCVRCACDEEGDMRMDRDDTPGRVAPAAGIEAEKGSCCGGTSSTSTQVSPSLLAQPPIRHSPQPSLTLSIAPQLTPPLLSPDSALQLGGSMTPLLSPESARNPQPPPSPLTRGRLSSQSSRSSRSSTPTKEAAAPASSSGPADQTLAPGLRRTSSTSQGHKQHVNKEQASAAARRATISQGQAALSRSGSSGKSASKALALHTTPHHPHPRPIAPKPVGGSGHLAPPKATSSSASSRGPSPHSRRGSSSGVPSRTVSPGPGPGPGPAPSAQQAPVAGLSQRQPSSVDLTTLSVGVASGSGSAATSHAAASMPPQINIDPSLDEFPPDGDFIDYINQLTYSSSGTSDGSSMPNTNYNFDMFNNNPFDGIPGFADASAGEVAGSIPPDINPDFYAMFAATFNNQSQGGASRDQQASAAPSLPVGSTGLSQSMSGLFLDQSNLGSVQQQHMGTSLSDALYDYDVNGQPRSRDPMMNEYLHTANAQPKAHQPQSQVPNPNLIDLSKPLDATDVERILRALQQQQQDQTQTQPQHPPPAVPHLPSQSPALPTPQQPMLNASHTLGQGSNGGYTYVNDPDPSTDDLFANFLFSQTIMRDAVNGGTIIDNGQGPGPHLQNQAQSGSKGQAVGANPAFGAIDPRYLAAGTSTSSSQSQVQNQDHGGLTWDQLKMWAASAGIDPSGMQDQQQLI